MAAEADIVHVSGIGQATSSAELPQEELQPKKKGKAKAKW